MSKKHPERPFFSWMGWGMLQACSRRWYLYSYSWDLGGDFGRRIQAERKLSYWSAFAGQLADDGITYCIREFKKTGQWPTDWSKKLHEIAREYVRDSREYTKAYIAQTDLPRVNRQVLIPYFFDEVPNEEQHRQILKSARDSVERFFQTDVPARIEAEPREHLMCESKVELFPWTVHEGIPFYAVYDFAIRRPDSAVIFDWKTGRLTPETEAKAVEQLHWYALYAIEDWKLSPDQIRIAPVFLTAGGYEERDVDHAILNRIRNEWRRKMDDIKARIRPGTKSEDLLVQFAMTDDLRECAQCQFRSCEGYARIVDAQRRSEGSNPVKLAIRGDLD